MLVARALTASAVAARHAGRLDDALDFIDEALARMRDDHADAVVGNLLSGMTPQVENERGEILDGLGRPDAARPIFEAYRQHALADGDHSNLAWALANLALVESAAGHAPAAHEYAEAAVQAADEGGYAPVQGDARIAAGLVELDHGDPLTARRPASPTRCGSTTPLGSC